MKILFTGASSFSGMWFVEELAKAGHDVTAVFLRPLEAYTGLRRRRVDRLLSICRPIFDCRFGSAVFLAVIDESNKWDLFCHHAADVTNYKSPEFAVSEALMSNTLNLPLILKSLKEKGCHHILLTGSVFEQNEGAGSDQLRAVSPYGLSKGLTGEVFRYYTAMMAMSLGKFVIPNPFGPFEEARFTTYLIQNWLKGQCAIVNSPVYVRDNVPISLLAKAYAAFAQRLYACPSSEFIKINPSYYVESQGAFTQRFAAEMRYRTALECLFDLKVQTEFNEPKVRINTERLDEQELQWVESDAWNELAEYYQQELALR